MPVWIKKSKAAPKRSGSFPPAYKIVVITVLVLSSSMVIAQRTSPAPPEVYDPFPEAHKPPSVAEMDRMASAVPANKSSILVENPAKDDACLLPPLNLTSTPSIAATQLQIAAEARAEYLKACTSVRKKKYADAEKHLRKSVSESPKYAEAWVTLGQVLREEQRTDEARRACMQGFTVNATYMPAYLCVADIAARERSWDEVLKLSGRAIELDPSTNAVAYEFHAAALLNLHEWTAAEKSGLRAVEIDKNHREPRVHFVLAQIYEAKGDSLNEVAQLREYLMYADNPGDISVAKQALSQLESHPGKVKDGAHPIDGSLSDPVQASIPRWAPAEIDERVPPVISDAPCPLPQILQQTSNRAQDLIESLQSFSANERIEQIDTDKNGKRRLLNTEEVNYVVQIAQNSSGYPRVEEYRSGTTGQRAAVIDSGIAASALIFHPTHIGNFDFRCEGLTQLRGSPAWQLHFEESADPNKSFTAIKVGRFVYLPRFKGRAWIAKNNDEILRIETDLVSPIPEIDLQLEHMVIDYAPVEFPKRQVRLWLPEDTAVYLAYRGHRYERTHKFSQFQLFSVDSSESIKGPITGVNGPSH